MKTLPITAAAVPSVQDDMGRYLQTIAEIPVLTVEEEQEIAKDLTDNNNLDAARQLVMHHLRFVVYIARGYNGYGLPLSDLVQEGNIGLMKAVKSFDPNRGVRLASFAVHWIKSEINEFIIKNWKLVKIATTKEQRKLFFNLRSMKKSFNWLTQSEAEQIANDLNVSKAQVFEMESRLSGQDITFDLPSDGDEETAYSPDQWLSNGDAEDPALMLEHEETERNSYNALHLAMRDLDDRSRDIVSRRWLNEDSKVTLQDLASEYGISAERVRQIENNAMKKIRTAIE